jgi:hypothetical protein
MQAMYDDLGPNHGDRRAKEWQGRRRVQGRADLGSGAELEPARVDFP